METINILIDRAIVTGVSVNMRDDGQMSIDVRVGLFAGSKPVTTLSFGTHSWDEKTKMDIPERIKDQIKTIMAMLNPEVHKKINGVMLPEPKNDLADIMAAGEPTSVIEPTWKAKQTKALSRKKTKTSSTQPESTNLTGTNNTSTTESWTDSTPTASRPLSPLAS